MATQVLVPVMGEAIGEARIAAWLKRVGDPVRRGDELAELETDKAVLMLECPADGVLLEILVAAGAMVTTGELLAQIGRPGEQAPIVDCTGRAPDRQSGGGRSGQVGQHAPSHGGRAPADFTRGTAHGAPTRHRRRRAHRR